MQETARMSLVWSCRAQILGKHILQWTLINIAVAGSECSSALARRCNINTAALKT